MIPDSKIDRAFPETGRIAVLVREMDSVPNQEAPVGIPHDSPGRRWLLSGALLTGVASLLHLAIILGGPDWYRFFGAGERLAGLAARGEFYPTVVTAGIAAVLGVWMLYALSGAGMIRRLPFLRLALVLIAAVYLARGALGIPMVLFADDPYANELRARMAFMIVTSAICIGLGLCYAVGAAQVWRRGPEVGR
jgi:putative oxidoreductase